MKAARSQAIAARRNQLRAEVARRLEIARGVQVARRAELARRPRSPREDERRRRRRWLLLLMLLLLLLLSRCPCVPPPVPQGAAPGVETALPEQISSPPDPPPAGVKRRDRPRFQVVAPEPLPWLAAFRLQVAARSPRLAECFTGADRPGALKWTAAVEPTHGRVSDPTLEPTLSSIELTQAQRACVLAVLATPAYTLDAGDSPSTPSRIGLVIEF